MFVNIYWITSSAPVRIGIMARPRGDDWLEDEIRFLASSGVEVLVSLLTDSEMYELGLVDEALHCTQQQMTYMSFPIPDRQTPPMNQSTFTIMQRLARLLEEQKPIVIHCRMGVGRSSLVAASVLAICGISTEKAFEAIAAARGCPVPDTVEQRAWVTQFERQYGLNAV